MGHCKDAALKTYSDIGRSVVFENDTDNVMIAGEERSLVACSEMLKLVWLTAIVFDDGALSGKADSNAHSSSSAFCAGGGGACDCSAGFGVNALKSNIDLGCVCCEGVD
jgi:hypothetical protein